MLQHPFSTRVDTFRKQGRTDHRRLTVVAGLLALRKASPGALCFEQVPPNTPPGPGGGASRKSPPGSSGSALLLLEETPPRALVALTWETLALRGAPAVPHLGCLARQWPPVHVHHEGEGQRLADAWPGNGRLSSRGPGRTDAPPVGTHGPVQDFSGNGFASGGWAQVLAANGCAGCCLCRVVPYFEVWGGNLPFCSAKRLISSNCGHFWSFRWAAAAKTLSGHFGA